MVDIWTNPSYLLFLPFPVRAHAPTFARSTPRSGAAATHVVETRCTGCGALPRQRSRIKMRSRSTRPTRPCGVPSRAVWRCSARRGPSDRRNAHCLPLASMLPPQIDHVKSAVTRGHECGKLPNFPTNALFVRKADSLPLQLAGE